MIAALPKDEAVKDAAAHDSEHSVEAIAYFLKHARADVEIVPVLIPAASFARLSTMATHLGDALATTMKKHKLQLGRDVAVIISTDGTHYGSDFSYTPFGGGGLEAFIKAMTQDRDLVQSTLAGPLSLDKAQKFFAAVVNPDKPDEYRMPWCGRFSVPFGLLFPRRDRQASRHSYARGDAADARRQRRHAGAQGARARRRCRRRRRTSITSSRSRACVRGGE